MSGNGAGLVFSGTGNHSINASGGTLELGAVTLTGDITGNSKNVTGVNNLAAGGTVTFSGFSTNNGLLYTSGTGLIEQTAAGSIGQCLEGNGAAAPIWATCAEGLNYWQMPNSGAIAPFSTTADLLVGGTSSTSAEFAFTGVDTNTPIASISAQSGSAPNGLSLNGATDMIQSLNDNTLTIGGNTTGNVLIAPGNMPVMTALSNNTIDFGTNTDLYLSGSNAFISNPQGQTGSEAFGANANVYGNYAVSVGNTAESEGSGVAVGANAEGYSDSVAIGSSANGGAGGSYGVSVGYETVSASYGIAIGAYAGADASDSIALGAGSVASSSNQIVIGSSFSNGGYINNAYIGSGISDTSPQGITIHATGASAGQTNLAGASLTLAGGLATGNAAGGSLLFQTSVAGTSGTSQQSLVTRMVIDNNGNVGVGITNPSNTFAVQSSPSTQNAIVNMYGSTCVSCYDYGVLEVTSAGGAIAAGQERPLLLQPAGQTYGTVGIGVGSIDPLATLDVRGNSNSTSVATISGNTSSSAFVVDNSGSGALFSANNTGLNRFTILQNGNVGIGTTTPAAPLQINGAYGNNAALIVNQLNNGDLIDASQGGILKFAISNGGAITTGSYTASIIGSAYGGTGADLHLQTVGAIPYFSGTGVMGGLAAGSIGQCLEGDGAAAPIWATCAGGQNYWQLNSGAIAPFSTTADLLLGGTSTTSAMFAFINNGGTGIPTASISANSGNNATYLTGAGVLGTTNMQSLTVGSSSTGNVSIAPGGTTSGINVTSSGKITMSTSPSVPFGNPAVGTAGGNDFGLLTAQDFTTSAGGGGTVSSMSVYIHSAVGASHLGQLAIYSDSSGTPGSYIASSAVTSLTGNSWNTMPVSATLSPSTTYWLVFWSNDSAGSEEALVHPSLSGYFDFSDVGWQCSSGCSGGTTNGFPNSFPTPLSFHDDTYDASIYVTYTTTSGPAMTIDPSGNIVQLGYNTELSFQGTNSYISNTQDYTNSEAFGLNASVNGVDAATLGEQSLAQAEGEAIGYSADAGTGAVAIGDGTSNANGTGGGYGEAIGLGASSATNGIAIGQDANDANDLSIAMGYAATTTATNQLVIGSSYNSGYGMYINSGYFGSGVTDTSPQSFTLNATGGSGSNINGANLFLAGGKGTGNATGGVISFETSIAGTSGSTLQTLEERMRIDNNGNIGIGSNFSTFPALATLDLRGNSGIYPVASISGNTAFANLIVDQSGSGDLFSASKSGTPIFTITNAGGIALFGSQGSNNQCITSNGVGQAVSWGSCGGIGTNNNYWQLNSGALAPYSTTLDLLLGGTATTSAKFAFTGVDTTSPVASIAANPASGTSNGLTFAGASDTIQSLNRNTLTIGGNTTGDISFRPGGQAVGNSIYLASNGNVGIGTANPGFQLSVVPANDSGGSTEAQFGATAPVYLGSNFPSIQFNEYWNGSHTKYGTTGYGATIDENMNNGNIEFIQSASGTGGNNVSNYDTDMVIDQYGDVGIGSQTPYSTLALQTGDNDNNVVLTLQDTSGPNEGFLGVIGTAGDYQTTGSVDDVFLRSQTNLLFGTDENGDERMRITNAGLVGIGTTSPAAPLQVTGAYGNNAALIVNNNNNGNLIDASDGGVLKFAISNGGAITTGSYTAAIIGSAYGGTGADLHLQTVGAIPYFSGTGVMGGLAAGSIGQCLEGNGAAAPIWATCAQGLNYWQMPNPGAIAPFSTTTDLLLGGTATTSAKFAFTGVDTTSPVASIAANPASGTSNGLTLAGATDTIQSLNRNTLTIGGNTTGDIALQAGGTNPDLYLASNGNIGVGTTTPVTSLDIEPPTNQGIALGTNSYPSWMGTAGIYLQGQIYALGGYIVGNNQAINWGQSTTQVYGVSNNNTSDYLYFGTNSLERLRINGFGELGFNTTSPLALFDIRGNGVGGSNALNGTIAVASFSGQTSFANTIVDQSGSGDIFTASKSGATKFTILNNGNIQLNNYTTAGGVFYGTNTGTLQLSAAGTSGQCLVSQGAVAPSWASCGPTGLWNQSSGALYEGNTTEDLLLGGTATTSAKFAFTGVDTTSPVASISANPGLGTANGLSLTGATDAIQSLNRNTLTIGGNTTGDISFQPGTQAAGGSLYLASNGNVGVGTTTPLATLQVGNFTNTTATFISNDNWTNTANGMPQFVGNSNWTGICWGIGQATGSTTDNTLRLGTTTFTNPNCTNTWATNQNMRLLLNGALGNSAQAALDLQAATGTLPVASFSGATTFANTVIDQSGTGDIFTASKSGASKFTITNAGGIKLGTNEGASGQCLLSGGAGAPATWGTCPGTATTTVTKPTDQTVNNSTTLVNDNSLLFSVGTNQTWTFQMYLSLTEANSTPQFKISITAPSGASCAFGIGSYDIPVSVESNTCGGTAAFTGGISATATGDVMVVTGEVQTGATAGNVQLQWAQDVANASNTTVKAGSYLNAQQTGTSTSNPANFINNGNAFGATAILGTNDSNALELETNGTVRSYLGTNGSIWSWDN